MFSEQDKAQMEAKGIASKQVEYQLDRFKEGFPSADIVAPATRERGIVYLDDEGKQDFADKFKDSQKDYQVCRFVPASGAATRMFKDLYALKDKLSGLDEEAQDAYVLEDEKAMEFFSQMKDYPFYDLLPDIETHNAYEIVSFILDEHGLNYGSLPKGQLLFHRNSKGGITAFEEHLYEAAAICSGKKEIDLHFTVSEAHLEGFKSLEERVVPGIEETREVKFNISYSFQKPETDTIAVSPDNQPFRNEDGTLVFRPGGHGALISNLNDLDSDVVFLNNVDNVSPARNRKRRATNKQHLGGLLLFLVQDIHAILEDVDKGEDLNLDAVLGWMEDELCIGVDDELFDASDEKKERFIREKLNRPIRVCGMVKNEDEPGGGPYFMRNSEGEVSLQVVELSQVDMAEGGKAEIARNLTHFNPVDLVCFVKDYKGQAFDLMDFMDEDTGFISEKSMQGRELKALELPGLWNGAMSDWVTVFAEVPVETFTPVKTVFDLVRSSHQ